MEILLPLSPFPWERLEKAAGNYGLFSPVPQPFQIHKLIHNRGLSLCTQHRLRTEMADAKVHTLLKGIENLEASQPFVLLVVSFGSSYLAGRSPKIIF